MLVMKTLPLPHLETLAWQTQLYTFSEGSVIEICLLSDMLLRYMSFKKFLKKAKTAVTEIFNCFSKISFSFSKNSLARHSPAAAAFSS